MARPGEQLLAFATPLKNFAAARRPASRICGMTKAWESKSVESQVEAAESRRQKENRPQLTAAEAEKLRQRESLLLSRTRVLRDLEETQNPRYRETLTAALKHLDEKLMELQ